MKRGEDITKAENRIENDISSLETMKSWQKGSTQNPGAKAEKHELPKSAPPPEMKLTKTFYINHLEIKPQQERKFTITARPIRCPRSLRSTHLPNRLAQLSLLLGFASTKTKTFSTKKIPPDANPRSNFPLVSTNGGQLMAYKTRGT